MNANEKVREMIKEWNSEFACTLVCKQTAERRRAALRWQALKAEQNN